MAKVDLEPAALAGSTSVDDILRGAALTAIRDSLSETARAQGKRGMVYLSVELCLGDGGEPLWVKSSVHFEQLRHHKDR